MRKESWSDLPPLVLAIADELATSPQVTAIAVAGSVTARTSDAQSDIDIYVYGPEPPPIDLRTNLARRYDPPPEIDNRAFGPGDEWLDASSGLSIDVMYWSPAWIEDQLARVLDHHLPATGYTTSFWRTILHSWAIVDPTGWFARLQERAQMPYPEPLRQAIVTLNHPLLRTARSSYLHQIERAIARNDATSVLHRTTAFLASYFDILFALNRVPHPGEKRLLSFIERECSLVPNGFHTHLHNLIAAVPPPWGAVSVVQEIQTLVDHLDQLLSDEGLLPPQSSSPSS